LLVSGPDISSEFVKSGLTESNALTLVRQLLSLRSFARTQNKTTDEVIEGVYEGLEASFKSKPEILQKLITFREQFAILIASDGVNIASKTHQLGQDHENLLNSSSIVTDIRPVFNPDRDKIAAAMVVNYLCLDVTEHGERRSVRYVLDMKDIERLLRQLNDLKKKSQVTSDLLKSNLDIRTFVVGDDSFGT
jgi:hypothetical protein